MNKKDFEKWNELSESVRKRRVVDAYKVLSALGKEQLKLLKRLIKMNKGATSRHLYFEKVLESIWKDGEFVMFMEKKRFSEYSFYAVRTMMEKMWKLIYFSKNNPSVQDEIFEKDSALLIYDFYKHEISSGGDGSEMKQHYNNINQGKLPEIEDIKKRSELKIFPSYSDICQKYQKSSFDNIYFSYRYLCSLAHGNILSIIGLGEQSPKEEYRRVGMIMCLVAIEVLKIANFHVGNSTDDQVKDSIKRAKNILLA